jgi:hypothetical protein
MKRVIALMLSFLITTSAFAGEGTRGAAASKSKKTAPRKSDVSTELQELKSMIQQQQEQINQLKLELQQRQQAVSEAQQQAVQAQSVATDAATKAVAAQNTAAESAQSFNALKADVSGLKESTTATAASLKEQEQKVKEAFESPVALHYKGITITPGGFLAAETVYRSHGTLGDINTGFNSIPLNGSDQSHLSEFFGSGRQSRISLLAEGKIKNAKLTGYYETDWLSAGVTSNNNQSNSYTNRQRQIWGQIAFNDGWTITGGQMWSLVTETKKGTDNRTEACCLQIDPQYVVGFSWARQFGFRVQKNFNNKVWLAFALENPQTTLAASGTASNFVVGGPGNGAGLYNPTTNYSLNYTPDFIAKAAFEPGFGHYEIFGVLSNFRDRIYPNATATTPSSVGATNAKLTGGGVGANARWLVHKKLELAIHAFGGNGVGRYGTSSLPDVTVRPDGSLAMLKAFQSYGTVEYHLPKWDFYMYGGGEYVGKSWDLNAAGKPVGYGSPLFDNTGCDVEALPSAGSGFGPGSPSKCSGQTRNIIEGTFGFWYKLYNGPKGRIQFGPQYSYLVRNTWSGLGVQPHAIENMLFTSFRYYLP